VAMASPVPKDPSERRNRNPKLRGEWVDIGVARLLARDVVLPPRDKVDPEGVWGAATVRTWDAWRHDPVSVYFAPADVDYAVVTIELCHLDAGFGAVKYASEIRLRMDAMGLTPKGKRDLRFRVSPSVEVGQVATRVPVVAGVTSLDARRKSLSA
jgi:hypothetical protein